MSEETKTVVKTISEGLSEEFDNLINQFVNDRGTDPETFIKNAYTFRYRLIAGLGIIQRVIDTSKPDVSQSIVTKVMQGWSSKDRSGF